MFATFLPTLEKAVQLALIDEMRYTYYGIVITLKMNRRWSPCKSKIFIETFPAWQPKDFF
ncbi:hypothetical protein GCM10026983_08860 [Gracilibacillus alcaliphilus]